MAFQPRSLLSLAIVAILPLSARAVSEPPFSLTENTGEIVIVSGDTGLTIDRATGNADSLLYKGVELLAGKRMYLNTVANGTYGTGLANYAKVAETDDRIHVMFSGSRQGFEISLHYVFFEGEAGFFVYWTLSRAPGAGTDSLNQVRLVVRTSSDFVHAYSSDGKQGQMIHPSLLAAATKVMDAAYRLPTPNDYSTPVGGDENGDPVYTKYDWAEYFEDQRVQGLSTGSLGLWIGTGSREYNNGGPTHASNIVQGSDTTPIILHLGHNGHFLGDGASLDFESGEVWSKVFGPVYVFTTEGDTAGQTWQNALAVKDQLVADWPHAWMAEPGYEVSRGTVSGSLSVDGQPAVNALMVLTESDGDWQLEGRRYLFWTRTDANGNFEIEKVRTGSYRLCGVVPGYSKEYSFNGVTVSAGTQTALGALSWNPDPAEHIVWRIGRPDRSSSEFRFGNRMRQHGLWWRYAEEMGENTLTYRIGRSNPANWYYALHNYARDDGTRFAPTWEVKFKLAALPSASADTQLEVDVVGAEGRLVVDLNGSMIGEVNVPANSAIRRSATRSARYDHVVIDIPAGALQAGDNTLSFTCGAPSWSGTKPAYPNRGIIWDAVTLTTTDPLAADFDQDGIRDGWELENFGNLSSVSGDSVGNADGDRSTDYDEYLNGTDPNSAASDLRIEGITVDGAEGVELRWGAVAGRLYGVEGGSSPGMLDSLTPIPVKAEGPEARFVHPGAPAERFFYRVVPAR